MRWIIEELLSNDQWSTPATFPLLCNSTNLIVQNSFFFFLLTSTYSESDSTLSSGLDSVWGSHVFWVQETSLSYFLVSKGIRISIFILVKIVNHIAILKDFLLWRKMVAFQSSENTFLPYNLIMNQAIFSLKRPNGNTPAIYNFYANHSIKMLK